MAHAAGSVSSAVFGGSEWAGVAIQGVPKKDETFLDPSSQRCSSLISFVARSSIFLDVGAIKWSHFLSKMKSSLAEDDVPPFLFPLIFHRYVEPLKSLFLESQNYLEFQERVCKCLNDAMRPLFPSLDLLKSGTIARVLNLSSSPDFSWRPYLDLSQRNSWVLHLPYSVMSHLKEAYDVGSSLVPFEPYRQGERVFSPRLEGVKKELFRDFRSFLLAQADAAQLPPDFPNRECIRSFRSEFARFLTREEFQDSYSVFIEEVQLSCRLLGFDEFGFITTVFKKKNFSEKECEQFVNPNEIKWAHFLLSTKVKLEAAHRKFRMELAQG